MNKHARNLYRKTVEYTYIVSGNEPCHFGVGSQLAVDETLYLALGPTIVDVNDGQHVPLKHKLNYILIAFITK